MKLISILITLLTLNFAVAGPLEDAALNATCANYVIETVNNRPLYQCLNQTEQSQVTNHTDFLRMIGERYCQRYPSQTECTDQTNFYYQNHRRMDDFRACPELLRKPKRNALVNPWTYWDLKQWLQQELDQAKAWYDGGDHSAVRFSMYQLKVREARERFVMGMKFLRAGAEGIFYVGGHSSPDSDYDMTSLAGRRGFLARLTKLQKDANFSGYDWFDSVASTTDIAERRLEAHNASLRRGPRIQALLATRHNADWDLANRITCEKDNDFADSGTDGDDWRIRYDSIASMSRYHCGNLRVSGAVEGALHNRIPRPN